VRIRRLAAALLAGASALVAPACAKLIGLDPPIEQPEDGSTQDVAAGVRESSDQAARTQDDTSTDGGADVDVDARAGADSDAGDRADADVGAGADADADADADAGARADADGGAGADAGAGVVVLAQGQSGAEAIAVTPTDVYWTMGSQGTVLKCAISGCPQGPTTFASAETNTDGLTIDSANVYWTNSPAGTVRLRPINASGSTATITVASGQNQPAAMTADSSYVYWVNSGDGTVMRCDSNVLNGLCGGQPKVLFAGPANPTAITRDSSYLYWTTLGGSVLKCSTGGCAAATSIATMQGQLRGVAVGTARVFWTDDSEGGVASAFINPNNTIASLAQRQAGPWGLAIDPLTTTLYWTNRDDGTVMKCVDPCTSGPTTVASVQDHPMALVVDMTNVYWINGGGSVVRAPL
jgi:hypothetical protein